MFQEAARRAVHANRHRLSPQLRRFLLAGDVAPGNLRRRTLAIATLAALVDDEIERPRMPGEIEAFIERVHQHDQHLIGRGHAP